MASDMDRGCIGKSHALGGIIRMLSTVNLPVGLGFCTYVRKFFIIYIVFVFCKWGCVLWAREFVWVGWTFFVFVLRYSVFRLLAMVRVYLCLCVLHYLLYVSWVGYARVGALSSRLCCSCVV